MLLQEGYENLVQGHPQNRRFIRGATGVCGVVNRVFPVSDSLDSEYRKGFDFIVVARVVAERTLFGKVVRIDVPLEYDLC